MFPLAALRSGDLGQPGRGRQQMGLQRGPMNRRLAADYLFQRAARHPALHPDSM